MKQEYAEKYLAELIKARLEIRDQLEKTPDSHYFQGKEAANDFAIEMFEIWSRP